MILYFFFYEPRVPWRRWRLWFSTIFSTKFIKTYKALNKFCLFFPAKPCSLIHLLKFARVGYAFFSFAPLAFNLPCESQIFQTHFLIMFSEQTSLKSGLSSLKIWTILEMSYVSNDTASKCDGRLILKDFLELWRHISSSLSCFVALTYARFLSECENKRALNIGYKTE